MLPIVKLSKEIYKQYPETEIFFISRKKIKVLSKNIHVANEIAKDPSLNSKYMVFIPSEECEVKGMCPIPTDYSEQVIFTSGAAKNMSHFGPVPNSYVLTEARRVQRRAAGTGAKFDINLVSLCFSGNVLPSHFNIDGVNYPIKPYR